MKRLAALLLIGSLNVTSGFAGTCQEAVLVCDKAYRAQKVELGLANQVIAKANDRMTQLEEEIKAKDGQLDAWYRNPFVIGALGVAAGVLIAK